MGQDPLRGPLHSAYGYAPLQERLAGKAGVDPDRVVHAIGTSMANLLVLAATAGPGDEVLIEEPTYSLRRSREAWSAWPGRWTRRHRRPVELGLTGPSASERLYFQKP